MEQILIDPAAPEIGQTANVYFDTQGQLGIAQIGSHQFVVHDGEVIPLPLREDRGITLALEIGKRRLGFFLEPIVLVPRLTHLNLPRSISYATSELCVAFRTENADEVAVNWRRSDEDNWHTAQMLEGAFALPIPRFETAIEIELELKSRHAAITRRAVYRHSQTLSVLHPDPQPCFHSSADQIFRYQPAFCDVYCDWIAEGMVKVDDCHKTMPISADGSAYERINLDTSSVGKKNVRLEVLGLDGHVRTYHHEVTILPRPIVPKLTIRPDGRLHFHLDGGSSLSLKVPLHGVDIPLESCEGLIEHDYCIPTVAFLTCIDDSGASHAYRIVLDQYGNGHMAEQNNEC